MVGHRESGQQMADGDGTGEILKWKVRKGPGCPRGRKSYWTGTGNGQGIRVGLEEVARIPPRRAPPWQALLLKRPPEASRYPPLPGRVLRTTGK